MFTHDRTHKRKAGIGHCLKNGNIENTLSAGKMNFKEKKKRNIILDFTPIVDVVFNLLIFFALSLNFTSNALLNINLPQIATQPKAEQNNSVSIQLTRQGDVLYNQMPIPIESLTNKIQETKEKNKEISVIIQADEQVAHGKVVRIMDICKRCGLKKISIAADVK